MKFNVEPSFAPPVQAETTPEKATLDAYNALRKAIDPEYSSKPVGRIDATDRPEYTPLKDKKVAQVDDSDLLLLAYLPDLFIATNGNVLPVLYDADTSTIESTVATLMAAQPDVVLMDYSLGRSNKTKEWAPDGDEVAKALIEAGFTGKVIGFSTQQDAKAAFAAAGFETIGKKIEPEFYSDIVAEVATFVGAENTNASELD